MKTDKLKDTVKSNVTAIVQEKTKQASDFWKSSYAKKAIMKTVEAMKNAQAITKVKNTLDPANIKAAAAKAYENVVKTSIAKTQAAMEKMGEQLARLIGWNNDLALEGALGHSGWHIEVENVDAKPDSTFQQIVVDRDGGGEQTKGTRKFDPLSNPKIAKEIESNLDAVYGYSPRKESPLNKFGVDWTNQEQVASARAKRMEYLKGMEQKKLKLESEVAKLQSEGMSVEEVARKMSEKRNLDRMQSYIDSNDSEGLAAMKERNMQQYGREEGPTPEQLFEKYGSWEEVIYGSVRTSPAMDVLTGLYKK